MTISAKKELSKQELFFEKVLASFATKFSSPSLDILSTRCISKSALLTHLLSIRDEVEFPGYKRISAKEILLHLERSKIVHPISTLDPRTEQEQNNFYILGLTSNENLVDPIELLQALEPKGVICYFTALDFYGLTSQIPSYYHIAKLVQSPLEVKKKEKYRKEISNVNRIFDPLGNKKFIYEGKTYYVTNREINLVPGIKERFLNDKTRFRITSLEQTLLDTLHKPLSCGGSSVVFEAWGNAKDKIKSDIVFEYLKKIGSNALSCRVGYMFQIMNYEFEEDLAEFLYSVKNSIKKDKPELAISLLPGLDFHQINHEWFVRVP